MKKNITIALAGNPNSGKTTIFNNLTGSRQRVGNYPGVTVEKKEGKTSCGDTEITVIDLPGTYSLTAYSPEEVVARHELLEGNIDVIVNIVDATNTERNLNLSVQLKELGLPMIIALNMVDMADKEGIVFDYDLLSSLMGAQVIPVVGTRNEGTRELLEAAVQAASEQKNPADKPLRYDDRIEKQILLIQGLIPPGLYAGKERGDALRRWSAIKLLEHDREVMKKIEALPESGRISEQVEKSRQFLAQLYNQDPESLIINGRYAFVRGACREAQKLTREVRESLTDIIDRVLLHRVLGIPVFLGMMWLLFQFTFALGAVPMEWLDAGFVKLSLLLEDLLPGGLLKSLLVDGLIGGVGGVVVFLPNILMLYLGIALLEGTGYMARTAFVTDKFMHLVGLHGKSFIPMLLGFGCSIPAVMATRTLEDSRDRLVTILVVPLMSCGARLPVYTLLSAAFFDKSRAGSILFSIYLIGIVLAVITAKILRSWVLPGESEPFVMELPAYRMPTLKSVLAQMWLRTRLYLKKAGTLILLASLLMWFLFTFPLAGNSGSSHTSPAVQLEHSYAGMAGRVLEPLLKPIGFDWKTGIALISGFAAKEVIVSTLGALYSIEDTESLSTAGEEPVRTFAERARLQSGFTPLNAYVLMLFVLIYVPCLATIAVIRRETNTWKWPLFSIGYTLALAWLICFLVYRAGLLLGLGV
ncbi:MAG: ferrous iron transport protein B [Peptococcaceae bacterium]|jgi:ferrous iron transport protein B|nr:ferrous iron transport protein B [Peptococcaceae bacterium]MDH7524549.1 ferrous iron transport protein B [Peptococcaceae bacterium]